MKKKMSHKKEEKLEEKVSPGIHKKIKKLSEKKKDRSKKHHSSKKPKSKVEKVMREYKHGELHSGSKKGPLVKNPKQAIAIALSEARKSGAKIPNKKK